MAPTASSATERPGRRWWPWVAGVVFALIALMIGSAWWAWRSDAGLDWLLRQVPGLEVHGMRGRPDGGSFEAARVEWRSAGLLVRVDGLSWRDAQWRWRPYPGAWLRVVLDAPHARQVRVTTTPGADEPAAAPTSLRLPLELVVRDLRVDTLQVNDQPQVTELKGQLHLGDDTGAMHRLGPLAATLDTLHASGRADVHTDAPMAMHGRVDVTAASAPGTPAPWKASATLAGTLPRMIVDGALNAAAGAQLFAQATVTPFEPWPLGALHARTQDLDLASLSPALPVTRLTGRAVVQTSGRDAPVSADLELSNAMPGTWDEARLPLRTLRATVRGHATDRRVLEFSGIEALLHGHQREAGRLTGTGRWQGGELSLDTRLDGVQPARLDDRLAAMTLSGPVRLVLRGVPAPPGAADTAAPSAPVSTEVHAELEGNLETGPVRPVRIATDATLTLPTDGSLHARIERLQLGAGEAKAVLSADAQRTVQGGWQLRTEGEFSRFDPSAWWAGPRNTAWRRGPHAINGTWRADLATPGALPADPRELLRALRGDARLQLRESRLAGVPLQATATLRSGERATQVDTTLSASGNRLSVHLATGARAADDDWRAELHAPRLAALAPLSRLVPGSARWLPTAGSLDASATAEGAWPALRTAGELHARGVRRAAFQVARMDVHWSASTSRVDAPLTLSVSARGLAQGERRIDQLEAELAGTLSQHRLRWRATSPLRPPAWTDAVLTSGKAPPRGGILRLDAAGGWSPSSGRGGTWQGHITGLRAAPPGEGSTAWAAARRIDARFSMDADGRLAEASLSPGEIQLLGATLRWTQASLVVPRTAGTPPRLSLDAELAPLAISPWLARWQPHFGWGGDLRIGGRMTIRSAAAFDAEVTFQRAGGDLTITDENGTRRLGLTALSVGLSAHGGTWRFTQSIIGSQLGELAGTQVVRTSPAAHWPAPDAPLQGTARLRIGDLAAWGAWLPPGWRLEGQLLANAAISGRFGAPQYTGAISGAHIGVRNLLEGVHLHDGTMSVRLSGTEARIEQLVFKGGDGTLRIEGGVAFGDSPRVQLQATARRFQALGRLDRRIVVSGNADLRMQARQLVLRGRFVVDEGLIDVSQESVRQLDDDVLVVNRPTGDGAKPAVASPASSGEPTPGLLGRADVALVIDLGDDLKLRGRGLDTELAGQLRVTTPDGELQVHGTVRTTSGTYTAYGQNLAIERGIVTFSGDVSTPRLDILAVRQDVDVRVGVAVQGGAVNPRVRLFSEPEMSEIDKLSWLVMGRASEGLGRADTALLQRAALALLAGEKGGSAQGIVERLGLDDLSLRRGESGDLQDTVMVLGKQISKRWYVGYERGLNVATGSWQLVYRIARRFTLRLQTGEENALDLIWTWRWN